MDDGVNCTQSCDCFPEDPQFETSTAGQGSFIIVELENGEEDRSGR